MEAGDFTAAGLHDPSAEGAEVRLALLHHLADAGVSLSDMAGAVDSGELVDLAGHRRLAPGEHTVLDLTARSGLSREQIERIWRWAGLPPRELDQPRFSDADVAVLTAFATLVRLTDEDTALSILRVFGASFSRMADVLAVAYLSQIEPANAAHALDEVGHAEANTASIAALGSASVGLAGLFPHHLRWALRRLRATFRGEEGFEHADLAVGFVDLVGYTALSQRLSSRELAHLVGEFETTAQDAVLSRDGRLVKLIGDAVMFTAVDAEPAVDIALRLLEAFSQRYEQIAPRGGIAVGEVLTRGGDYYGPVVNLASRIADQAVPSEILVTNDVYLRVEFAGADLSKTLGPGRAGRYRFESAGRRTLKGFDDPVKLFSAGRRDT